MGMTKIGLSGLINIMAPDVLVTQGARESAATVLTQFSRSIPVPAPEG